MSVPNMPSFDLTTEEKYSMEEEVYSLLAHGASLLDSRRKNLSLNDYCEAFYVIKHALYLANDPDACDKAPLAQCNLYMGHILQALHRYPEALDVYRIASKVCTSNAMDRYASGEAASLTLVMDEKVRRAKREGGVWSDAFNMACLRISRGLFNNGYSMDQLRKAELFFPWSPEPRIRIGKGPLVQRPRLVKSLV
ncbi:hypothetical protein F4779DRAFT_619688 [Xylariaceae sp. FL0662B]|nr:hypothetical protein F4779DRAFT_619688 [Xylariaceae sp. FL0662B]